ncbi:MAG: peptidoglycan DD-metalloendopeptidase family protein [Deltaproteobacteria bacterium]|jgi:murein DD-endopeptidase MepM/ murein hydrolase activator NlpD|nr:peptidoglycan DD-metalloendopeptidase family protein [Deltaproteobacteria bacterium]
MHKYPFFLLLACFALLAAAYDASAKVPRSAAAVTAEDGAASTKAATSKSTGVAAKEAAKAPDVSGTGTGAKKSSGKQEAQAADTPKSKAKLKDKSSQVQDAKSRQYKKSSRDPASLPAVDEAFAETPHAALAVLSTIPADGDISSFFGARRVSGKAKRGRMHTGVDIMAGRGTPVLAAASGVVCYAGSWAAYGKIVEIDHGNGLVTRYAHLDAHAVEDGAMVAAGEPIGIVGRTGRTTGAHLHFETLVNGRMVDPMLAEMWQETPERMAAKRGMYVSGLRSAKRAY